MDEQKSWEKPAAGKDFTKFWRIPEGDCELLSASFSKQIFARHSHERYAIGVICSGVEKMFYRGRYCLGGAGSVVTITPGEIHDGLPAHEQGWMYRMLYLEPNWLNRAVLPGQADNYIHLFDTAFDQAPAFANVFLHYHCGIEQSRSSLERESLLLDLVAQVFKRGGAPIRPVSAFEKRAVQQIRRKLEDDFDKQVSLEELSSLSGLESLYMIRVFKNSVGVPPHSYQIQVRVGHAQRLLRDGMSIADTSYACGFFDQSHMTRAFKKVVGITPGAFRIGRSRS